MYVCINTRSMVTMQAIAIDQQNLVNDLVYLYVYEVTNSAACISIGVIFYPIGNI